jgi:cell division protein FtsB
MPSARPATNAAARDGTQPATPAPARERPAPRPHRVPLRDSVQRLRWERLGRIALLVVLLAVVGLYAEHTLSYVSTRAQNGRQQAMVDRLTRQYQALEAQKRALSDPSTIVRQARSLGMTRPGEQPFDITGAGR